MCRAAEMFKDQGDLLNLINIQQKHQKNKQTPVYNGILTVFFFNQQTDN